MLMKYKVAEHPSAGGFLHFPARAGDEVMKMQTVILSQEPLDENALRAAIDAACYTTGDIQTKTCEKKESFPSLKKQSVIF